MTFFEKAFRICIIAFTPALIIAIIAIITNWLVPDEIFNNPAYSGDYVGIESVISLIKAIDTADYYFTLFSAIASGITYLLSKMGL